MFNTSQDVFLSYAREDLEFARKLYDDLSAQGISVWFDEEKLDGGEKWKTTIKTAIPQSTFFIAVISSKSVDKEGYVQEEIAQAIEVQKQKDYQDIFIIPIRIDECEIPYSELKGINHLDFFVNYEKYLKNLFNTIWSQKGKKNLEIIGFDLGHGETASALTNLATSSQPQIIDINGKSSIITAVAITVKGIVIGEDAYVASDLSHLFTLFKSSKVHSWQTTEPIELFIKKYLDIIKKQGKVKLNENTCFFVGSPSGWSQAQRKGYEKLLRSSGMRNVIVRPESRAAFLDARESGVLKEDFQQISDSVLIIDIGSSTTDFTLVENYKEAPLDFGENDLGASLIEKEIFNKSFHLHSDEEQVNIQRWFDKNPTSKVKCLLMCRSAKEDFFSKSDLSSEEVPVQEVQILDRKTKLFFELELDNNFIQDILEQKIDILGDTWPNIFRKKLQNYKRNQNVRDVKLILLTGGGSRMNFVRKICEEEFEESRVLLGLEPELTVAKGLALLGRIDFKIASFRAEVDALIESEDVQNIVTQELSLICESTSECFADKCLELFHLYTQSWVVGDFNTIGQLNLSIQKEMDRYASDEEWISDIAVEKFSRTFSKIEDLSHSICDKYQIPRTILNLAFKLDELSGFKGKELNWFEQMSILNDLKFIGAIGAMFSGSLSISLVAYIAAYFVPFFWFGLLGNVAINILKRYLIPNTLEEELNEIEWKKAMENYDIPRFLRKIMAVYMRENIDKQSTRQEIKQAFIKSLESNVMLKKTKDNPMLIEIKKALYGRADEAAILISQSDQAASGAILFEKKAK